MDALMSQEVQVTLTKLGIIQFAYLVADLISACMQENAMLMFEEANCYRSCFYQVRSVWQVENA